MEADDLGTYDVSSHALAGSLTASAVVTADEELAGCADGDLLRAAVDDVSEDWLVEGPAGFGSRSGTPSPPSWVPGWRTSRRGCPV